MTVLSRLLVRQNNQTDPIIPVPPSAPEPPSIPVPPSNPVPPSIPNSGQVTNGIRHARPVIAFIIGLSIIILASVLNAAGLNLTKLDHVLVAPITPLVASLTDCHAPAGPN
jgi:hypothetical protein